MINSCIVDEEVLWVHPNLPCFLQTTTQISNFQLRSSTIEKNCPISSNFVLIAGKLDLLMQPWRQVERINLTGGANIIKFLARVIFKLGNCLVNLPQKGLMKIF